MAERSKAPDSSFKQNLIEIYVCSGQCILAWVQIPLLSNFFPLNYLLYCFLLIENISDF